MWYNFIKEKENIISELQKNISQLEQKIQMSPSSLRSKNQLKENDDLNKYLNKSTKNLISIFFKLFLTAIPQIRINTTIAATTIRAIAPPPRPKNIIFLLFNGRF